MITFFVEFEDEDGRNCFELESGSGMEAKDYKMIDDPWASNGNKAVRTAKWIHLICFICLIIRENTVDLQIETRTFVTKILLGFITVPLYIFSICWLIITKDEMRFMFDPASTKEDYKALG